MDKYRHNGITELRKAARKRLADARALLETGLVDHTRAAGYLAGYAIECKLKAIAMEANRCWTLTALAQRWRVGEREVYSHGLEALGRRMPALWRRLELSPCCSDFVRVNSWRPSWRYDPHAWRLDQADAFVRSATKLVNWLESNRG